MQFHKQRFLGWLLLIIGSVLILSCLPFSIWSILIGIVLFLIGLILLSTC